MTRVLLVGKGPPDRGGIAAYLHMLLASELRHRHDVRFLNLSRDEPPRAARLTVGNVTRTLQDSAAVWRSSRDRDLVHLHTALVPHVTFLRAGLLALAARGRRRKVIIHAHSGAVGAWLSAATRRRLLARLCLLPANAVATVDHASAAELRRVVAADRVFLVENGVSLPEFRPGTGRHRPPRLLYAGLLSPRKGVLDLLAASSLLCERGVRHELWLAGGTPDEGVDDERTVRDAAAGKPEARLLGPLPHPEMAALYRAVDVFCLPSWYEAMPLSVLEAMASGLPVVATSVGDVPRAVTDGVTGLLVAPRCPEELADALARLIADPEERRRMGAAGRERAEKRFDAVETVRAVDSMYERTTKRP